MSERISIAKLREQFTLWPQVLHVLDTVEAARVASEWVDCTTYGEPEQVQASADLDAALARFDFEDA